MKTRLLVSIFLGFTACAWAQVPAGSPASPREPAKPELPSSPLLGKAPEFSEWGITFTYASEAARKAKPESASQPRLAYLDKRSSRVTTTKTGKIIHEVTRDLAGTQTEIWSEGTTQYYQMPGNTLWFESGNTTSAAGVREVDSRALPPSGFRDLDWITADNYAGTIPYGNGSCFIFVPEGYRKLDLRDEGKRTKLLESQGKIAYVDADTRMPVAVRDGDVTRVFRFNSPPTAMQTFPADLSKAINDGKEARRRLEQPAARPY